VTPYEAQEEENHRVRITDFNNNSNRQPSSSVVTNQRVLSFKEKKSRPSMSLANNISLIAAIAKEKTHS
jgi:cell division cycle protein 20 (cofactor of APC complex)